MKQFKKKTINSRNIRKIFRIPKRKDGYQELIPFKKGHNFKGEKVLRVLF